MGPSGHIEARDDILLGARRERGRWAGFCFSNVAQQTVFCRGVRVRRRFNATTSPPPRTGLVGTLARRCLLPRLGSYVGNPDPCLILRHTTDLLLASAHRADGATARHDDVETIGRTNNRERPMVNEVPFFGHSISSQRLLEHRAAADLYSLRCMAQDTDTLIASCGSHHEG